MSRSQQRRAERLSIQARHEASNNRVGLHDTTKGQSIRQLPASATYTTTYHADLSGGHTTQKEYATLSDLKLSAITAAQNMSLATTLSPLHATKCTPSHPLSSSYTTTSKISRSSDKIVTRSYLDDSDVELGSASTSASTPLSPQVNSYFGRVRTWNLGDLGSKSDRSALSRRPEIKQFQQNKSTPSAPLQLANHGGHPIPSFLTPNKLAPTNNAVSEQQIEVLENELTEAQRGYKDALRLVKSSVESQLMNPRSHSDEIHDPSTLSGPESVTMGATLLDLADAKHVIRDLREEVKLRNAQGMRKDELLAMQAVDLHSLKMRHNNLEEEFIRREQELQARETEVSSFTDYQSLSLSTSIIGDDARFCPCHHYLSLQQFLYMLC